MLLSSCECEQLAAGAEDQLRCRSLLHAALFVSCDDGRLAAICNCTCHTVRLVKQALTKRCGVIPVPLRVPDVGEHPVPVRGLLRFFLGSTGELVELYGRAGVGKSQVCAWLMACALERWASSDSHVLLVGSGRAQRGSMIQRVSDMLTCQDQLSYLRSTDCTSVSQLMTLVDCLHTRPCPELRLLVVDCVYDLMASPLLRHSCMDPAVAPALLHQLAASLKYLAARDSLTIVLTNRSVSDADSRQVAVAGSGGDCRVERREVPALGLAWRAAPHSRVQLLSSGDSGGTNTRRAMLVKSCRQAVPQGVRFLIDRHRLDVVE